MIWIVAHYDGQKEDWSIDLIGTEQMAKDMLAELHQQFPTRLFHLFAEVEAASLHFREDTVEV